MYVCMYVCMYVFSERLELLGDSLLKLVTSVELFRIYPNKHEGFLTDKRGKVLKKNIRYCMHGNDVYLITNVHTVTFKSHIILL